MWLDSTCRCLTTCLQRSTQTHDVVALDPRAAPVGVYIVRTALEDGMLQKELVGYRAYAHDVRHSLLGIW